jgi:hypothetical protein
MVYNCVSCNRQFGDNKVKYEYHLTTSSHIRNVKKCQPVLNENTNTAELLKLVQQLTAQVQSLQSGNTIIPDTQQRQENNPYSFTTIIKNKLYTQDEMIQRTHPNILKPKEDWLKFIFNGYKWKSRETHITCEYKPHQIAANLLLTKFLNTPQELLPIIVLNNDRGKNKKICYYTKEGKFDVKTNVAKTENIDLYRRLDMYIFKAFSQTWYEDKLKEIYRDMPIEIRNKIHYHTTDDNKLSFLDFKCCCNDNSHRGCYREMIVDDDRCQIWRYKNQELINVDGGTFRLGEDEYVDFVSEYVNAIEDHEHAHIYNDFREQKEMARFDEEAEKIRYRIVDELYGLILERCLYVVCDEDE